jgi:hypothetical protein
VNCNKTHNFIERSCISSVIQNKRTMLLRNHLLLACLLLAGFTAQSKTVQSTPPQKIITIIMDAGHGIIMGRDTVELEIIPALLSERLWKSYLGTGKMYDSIKVVITGDVQKGNRGSLYEAIEKAQQLALKKLCLEQHKRLFSELSTAQQQRVRQKYKVLFQQPF